MGRRALRRVRFSILFPDELFWPCLLAVMAVLGGVVGFLVAFVGNSGTDVAGYLLDYFVGVAAAEGVRVNVCSVLWDLLRWPLLAFLLAMSRVGFVGLPLLLMLRSFLLAHAITVLVVSFRAVGALAALAVFGVPVFFVLPLVFLVGCEGVRTIGSGGCGVAVWLGRDKIILLLCCVAGLSAAVILQCSAMPMVLSVVCRRFF